MQAIVELVISMLCPSRVTGILWSTMSKVADMSSFTSDTLCRRSSILKILMISNSESRQRAKCHESTHNLLSIPGLKLHFTPPPRWLDGAFLDLDAESIEGEVDDYYRELYKIQKVN